MKALKETLVPFLMKSTFQQNCLQGSSIKLAQMKVFSVILWWKLTFNYERVALSFSCNKHTFLIIWELWKLFHGSISTNCCLNSNKQNRLVMNSYSNWVNHITKLFQAWTLEEWWASCLPFLLEPPSYLNNTRNLFSISKSTNFPT